MNKRLVGEYREFIFRGEKTPFSLGTLSVVVFCTVLLIVATFTKLDVTYYWPTFGKDGLTFILKKYPLVPQIPVIMATAAILGARFGTLVMLLYLLTGFFLWPVFGFGGGIGYVKSYFFGYILGFFAANIFAGRILSHKYNLMNMLYASIIGVLSIHMCGILYSLILELFKFSGVAPNFQTLISHIVYDTVFSFIAIVLAKPVKYILWIAMKNEPRRQKVLKNSNVNVQGN